MHEIKVLDRASINGRMERWIRSIAIGCFLLFIFSACVIKNEILADILLALWIYCIYMWFALLYRRYKSGYFLEEDGLLYRRWFMKQKIYYNNMNYLVFSVAMPVNNGRLESPYLGKTKIVNKRICEAAYPWITLIEGDSEIIHTLLLRKEWGEELKGDMIDKYMQPRGIYCYSFVWNDECQMDRLLRKFQGEYYITYSLLARYPDMVEEFLREFLIDEKRVHLIVDKGEFKNFYKKVDYAKVRKLLQKLYNNALQVK